MLSMTLMGTPLRQRSGVLMSMVALLPFQAFQVVFDSCNWAEDICTAAVLKFPWANTPNFQRTLANGKSVSFLIVPVE